MGAMMTCLAADLACCFGRTACKCCFSMLGCRGSTATRTTYAVIFGFNSMVSWIMLTDWAKRKFKEHFDDLPFYKINCPGGSCYGVLATYRMTLALVLFHTMLAMLTYGVRNTQQTRAAIQNGFWGVKLLVYIGLVCLCFFTVPIDGLITYSKVATVFATFFILIQLVLVIDLAYRTSERCLIRYEDSDDQRWLILLFAGTVALYVGTVVASGFMYAHFGGGQCQLNQFFITFNLLLGVVASVIAIHPRVQEENPQSGLAQAAAVTAYTTYLIFNALTNEPDTHCNTWHDNTNPHTTNIFVGASLTFLAIVYSTSTTAVKGQVFLSHEELAGDVDGVPLLGRNEGGVTTANAAADDDVDSEFHDERDDVNYNYSFFHIVYCTASMYVAMLLTNWDSITLTYNSDRPAELGHSWQAVWAKVITSWVAILMYIWTLVAPIALPDRDWDR